MVALYLVAMTVMTVRWPDDVYEELRRLAYERRDKMTPMVVQAVREYLERQPDSEKAGAAR